MSVPRKQVLTSLAPLPPSFLSQAIVAGDVVYCSGQIGVDPETGKLVNGTVGDRTRQVLRNLTAVLEAAGSNLQEAIRVNCYLSDMDDFSEMNFAYEAFFNEPRPARTCVAVKNLPANTDIEIECMALILREPKCSHM